MTKLSSVQLIFTILSFIFSGISLVQGGEAKSSAAFKKEVRIKNGKPQVHLIETMHQTEIADPTHAYERETRNIEIQHNIRARRKGSLEDYEPAPSSGIPRLTSTEAQKLFDEHYEKEKSLKSGLKKFKDKLKAKIKEP
jgi:hypothetical protein